MSTPCPASLLETESGLDDFFGCHLGPRAVDLVLLRYAEPALFKGASALQETCWFGYRFMHPGHRIYLYIHHYKKAFERIQRQLGRRWIRPAFLSGNPVITAKKQHLTAFVSGAFTADGFGIPYEIWCDSIMDESLRYGVSNALLPNHMYTKRAVNIATVKWADRNQYGIYLAKAKQYLADNFNDHPWQVGYQKYLCDAVSNKGNRRHYISRLMFDIGQLTETFARSRFGDEIVDDAIALRAS